MNEGWTDLGQALGDAGLSMELVEHEEAEAKPDVILWPGERARDEVTMLDEAYDFPEGRLDDFYDAIDYGERYAQRGWHGWRLRAVTHRAERRAIRDPRQCRKDRAGG